MLSGFLAEWLQAHFSEPVALLLLMAVYALACLGLFIPMLAYIVSIDEDDERVWRDLAADHPWLVRWSWLSALLDWRLALTVAALVWLGGLAVGEYRRYCPRKK